MKRLLVVLAACGDNLYPDGDPLPTAPALTIVAHQDDDLLFMQPEEYAAFASGDGAVNVYVTAGNATKGVDYAELRYRSLRAAYGDIVNSEHWDCGWISVLDHRVEHCRVGKASLVFLGYPDGGKMGQLDHSLLKLWEGKIDSAETVAHEPSTYTQQELIDVVAEIIDEVQPQTLRTLDVSGAHGRDHSDHMMVGALTVLALGKAHTSPRLISYRGYDTESEPENVLPAYFARSLGPLARYEGCVNGSVTCGVPAAMVDNSHSIWMHRRYSVGFRPVGLGRLQLGDQCLDQDGTGVALRDCATATSWQLDGDGGIVGDGCVQVLPTGELAIGDCAEKSKLRLDDEGHIWAPIPPVPMDGLDLDHGTCLDADGGRVRALRCGATHAASWLLRPPAVTQPLATALGAQVSGRVVLAQVNGGPALCTLDATDQVRCAPSAGEEAALGPPVVLGGTLAIDPASLVIGDIDSDGTSDACGLGAKGPICESFSGDGTFGVGRFAGTPVSSTLTFGRAGDVPALCAQTSLGVECATAGGATTLSTWPTSTSKAVFADLDGDGQTDWCAIDAGGNASCAVIADRMLTTDGMPWSFTQNGAVTPVAGDVALGDLDRDGRADLCQLSGNDVVCRRSADHGFGPAFVAMTPPTTPVQLVMGDLDGDGIADLCTIDGAGGLTCSWSRRPNLLASAPLSRATRSR